LSAFPLWWRRKTSEAVLVGDTKTFNTSRAAPITGVLDGTKEKGWGRDSTEHNGRLSSSYTSEGDCEPARVLCRHSASHLSGCRCRS
ncbi:unnamed protein product, partial [Ixodes persulcatus]